MNLVDIPADETVFVHHFEESTLTGPQAFITTRKVTRGDLDNMDLLGLHYTSEYPIDGIQIDLDREQFEGWVAEACEKSRAAGNEGLLFGHDPLRPEKTIDQADLGISEECVFLWNRNRGEGPIFEWSMVSQIWANRNNDVATIFLTDGRVVVFNANIDWVERYR